MLVLALIILVGLYFIVTSIMEAIFGHGDPEKGNLTERAADRVARDAITIIDKVARRIKKSP